MSGIIWRQEEERTLIRILFICRGNSDAVTAVESLEEMLSSAAWKDHEYKQIIGDVCIMKKDRN